MASSRHSRTTAHDELGRFTSINEENNEETELSPPPAGTSFRQNTPFSSPISPSLESMLPELQAQTKIDTPEESNSSGPDCLPNPFQPTQLAPTNDLLQQLIQAMAMMGQAADSVKTG